MTYQIIAGACVIFVAWVLYILSEARIKKDAERSNEIDGLILHSKLVVEYNMQLHSYIALRNMIDIAFDCRPEMSLSVMLENWSDTAYLAAIIRQRGVYSYDGFPHVYGRDYGVLNGPWEVVVWQEIGEMLRDCNVTIVGGKGLASIDELHKESIDLLDANFRAYLRRNEEEVVV